MSLVQAYINQNYILVCGEQKATVNGYYNLTDLEGGYFINIS